MISDRHLIKTFLVTYLFVGMTLIGNNCWLVLKKLFWVLIVRDDCDIIRLLSLTIYISVPYYDVLGQLLVVDCAVVDFLIAFKLAFVIVY